MGELLLKTGNYLFDTAINRMLTAAGLTLATASIAAPTLNHLIAQAQSELSGLSALGLAVVDLSGVDEALSLTISAVLARISVHQGQLFLMRAKS